MSARKTQQLQQEAEVLAHYLVGVAPPVRAVELYCDVIGDDAAPSLSERDARLLRFAALHRWSVGLIDSGLSLSGSKSEFRRRMYLLFSILESQPELCDYFLPQDRSVWYIGVIFWQGLIAVLRSVAGLVFIKAMRL